LIKKAIKSRLIFILLFSIIFFSYLEIFAEEVTELDLNQAINLALKNNLSLKIADLELKNAEIDYDKTKADNLLTSSRYVELQGELGLLQANDNYAQTRNEIIIEVVQKYIQLLMAKKNIFLKEKGTELEKNLFEEVKAQVDAGHKGSLELLQQENEYYNAVFELEKANNDYNQSFKEFIFELGIDEAEEQEQEFNLKEISYPQIWNIDEETALKEAVEQSFVLELCQRKIELAQIDLERAIVASSPSLEIQQLKNNIVLSNLDYEKTLKELNNSISKQYYSYKQAINSLNLSQQNLKQAQENYYILSEQVKAGLKTKNDLLSAEINLLQAEYNLNSALLNYHLAKLTLQQLMGQDIKGVEIE